MSRIGYLLLAVIVIAAGLALNWDWLVAAGVAPILVAFLPCAVMCGLGLCFIPKREGKVVDADTSAPIAGPISRIDGKS